MQLAQGNLQTLLPRESVRGVVRAPQGRERWRPVGQQRGLPAMRVSGGSFKQKPWLEGLLHLGTHAEDTGQGGEDRSVTQAFGEVAG